MKTSRYTEEQIAFALKQAETGTPVEAWRRDYMRGGLTHRLAGRRRSNMLPQRPRRPLNECRILTLGLDEKPGDPHIQIALVIVRVTGAASALPG